MPIIEPVPAGLPLSQGDVLQGIQLFSTRECWGPNGGEAALANGQHCLVISRPCVASHKGHVTVIPIEQVRGGIPSDIKTFDDVLKFLRDTRDGVDAPDNFYVGELPGKSGRYSARLDSFHNVQVPSDPRDRQTFLDSRRIGRLSIDFARDLHVRIFRAFASLGFDDISWLTDQDLQWIVDKGRSELASAEQSFHERQAAKSQKDFEGKTFPSNEIAAAQNKVEEMKAKLVAFEDELARRTS